MATMKDIARIAGVSHGTVSNVLNGRGNVSVEKMEMVLNAAKQAGYRLNTQAQLLRSNSSNKIAVVLPQLLSEKYAYFFNALRQTFEEYPDVSYDLFFTDDLETNELKILQKIASGGYAQVIAISCLSDASPYFDILDLASENVVFVYRKPLNAQVYYSLDYNQAASSVVDSLCLDSVHSIGVFADNKNYLNSQAFIDAIQNQVMAKLPNTSLSIHYSSDVEAYNTAFDFFTRHQLVDIIIAQDIEKSRYLTQASHFGSAQACPPIYCLTSNISPMLEGLHCFPVNYAQLGQDVANYLLLKGEEPRDKPETTIIANLGRRIYTGQLPPVHHDNEGATLNLLTLPSPSTSALQKLLPNFYRQTGITVNLAIRPFDEIFNLLSELDKHTYYDLVRLDVAFFPWLAEKNLLPLNQIGDGIEDLLLKFTETKQKRFSLVNEIAYGMPFDASVQLLFYRKDIFDDAVTKRLFFETTGKELRPPETFAEYDELNYFFYNHREEGNPLRPVGSSTTTGSAGIISSEYLLRYYAAGGKLVENKTTAKLEPQLAESVLNDYLKQLTMTKNVHSEWWGDSIKLFEQGNLAMIIAYMNLFNDVAHSEISPKIGFAPVPGGIPQLGGGVLGASKYSKKSSLMAQFYRWLYSNVIMDRLVMLGGNNIQRNFTYSQEIKHRYPWLPLAYEQINHGIRESVSANNKIFNLRRAEGVIGLGVTNAIDGIMTAKEAIRYINTSLNTLAN